MAYLDNNHPCFHCEDKERCRAERMGLIPEFKNLRTYGCTVAAEYEQKPLPERKFVKI